ncbi:MAG: 50S ribosomal protein L32 [Minisyncoccales bacterium]|jgi:large subunit ribosomal protein L32|nr:50S ribosomal protein L32 [Candidatus Pacearchaeota archaeon]
MGGVPKKRHTKGSRNQRRMHLFLKNPSFSQCAKCGKPVKSHHACPFCGHYRGKEAVDVFSRLDRKQRRDRESEIAAQATAKETKTSEAIN